MTNDQCDEIYGRHNMSLLGTDFQEYERAKLRKAFALGQMNFPRFTHEEREELSGSVIMFESMLNDLEDWLIARSNRVIGEQEISLLREIEQAARGWGPKYLWPIFEKLDALREAMK